MMKIHQGQRDELEKKLVKSLFTEGFDKYELTQLKPKGKLTLCERASVPDVQLTPHQSNEDPA